MFDKATLGIAGLFRIGPWYCVHCDYKTFMLLGKRSDALDYRSAALGNEDQPLTRKQTKPVLKTQAKPNQVKTPQAKPKPIQTPPVTAETAPSVPVGNYLKTDKSLTHRKHRLERFSEKYRDAVVRRIMTGSATISQIRNDKQLSESELAEWIADLFNRRQQKIDKLERIVQSITLAEKTSGQSQLGLEPASIEARSKPK